MNIYKWEFKISLKTLLYWTISLVFIVIFFMCLYPYIYKNSVSYEKILNNFPQKFKDALGLSSLKMSNILGFYCFLFNYIILVGSIFAMKLGVSSLSEEIRSKTVDFLISKPISRFRIAAAKILCILTYIFLQNIIYFIFSLCIINYFKKSEFDFSKFVLINLSLLLIQLFFITLGFFISIAIKKIKSVMPITLGIVFFFFVLKMLNETLKNTTLSYFTPFEYFNVSKILKTDSYDWQYFLINIILIISFTFLAFFIYQKKDLSAT